MFKESEVIAKLLTLDIWEYTHTQEYFSSTTKYYFKNGSYIEKFYTSGCEVFSVKTKSGKEVPFPEQRDYMLSIIKVMIDKWEAKRNHDEQQRIWKEFLND